MRRNSTSRSQGFSLLEVLVSFVILALVATALFRLFSGSLANVGAAEDYSRAVIVAESVLAETGGAQPLHEGSWSGSADDGRVSWRASVSPWDPPDVGADIANASSMMALRLYRVAVEVDFPAPSGGQRKVALATTRLGARERLQ